MSIESYRDLLVWQKAMDLVVEIYRLTKAFPPDERFGLTIQIRRVAVSIPSNIAEGHGRLHRADFLRFLSIARGSLTELETQLQIATRLGYLDARQTEQSWDLVRHVGRALNGLIRSLNSENPRSNGGGRIAETSDNYETDWPLTPDP